MLKDKIAEVANNFLIGEGPFITIISSNQEGLDCHQALIEQAQKLGGVYLFDCYIGNNFMDRKIAISGLYPTQAVFLAMQFNIKNFIQKDWDGKLHYMTKSPSWWSHNNIRDPSGFIYLSKMNYPSGSSYLSLDFKFNY